jgi:hypothetical protein
MSWPAGCTRPSGGCQAADRWQAAFRDGLTARGSPYVVQVHGDLTTHAIDAVPELIGYSGPGPRSKPRYRTRPTGPREHLLAAGRTAAVQVRWRDASRGPMTSAFVALHVRPAGRRPTGRLAADGSLPAVWLLAEWPPWAAEPTDYWLSTLPEGAALAELVRLAKIHWRVEHDYRELKTALGLDHFEGRIGSGWHRHVTLVTAAQLFLTPLRSDPEAAAPAPASTGSCTGCRPCWRSGPAPASPADNASPATLERRPDEALLGDEWAAPVCRP